MACGNRVLGRSHFPVLVLNRVHNAATLASRSAPPKDPADNRPDVDFWGVRVILAYENSTGGLGGFRIWQSQWASLPARLQRLYASGEEKEHMKCFQRILI